MGPQRLHLSFLPVSGFTNEASVEAPGEASAGSGSRTEYAAHSAEAIPEASCLSHVLSHLCSDHGQAPFLPYTCSMYHMQEERNGLTDFRTLPQGFWVRLKTPWALPAFGNQVDTSVKRTALTSLLAFLQKKRPIRCQCICATDGTRAYLLQRCPKLSLVKGSEMVTYTIGSYLWV